MAGVTFRLEFAARHERAHLSEARHGLHAFPEAHLRHLAHQCADLIELIEELLDLVRLGAAAGRDAPATALVDHVGIASFFFGHRVDHALHPLQRDFGVLAFGNHFAHAGHAADHVLHAQFLNLRELIAEVLERQVALLHLLLLLASIPLR